MVTQLVLGSWLHRNVFLCLTLGQVLRMVLWIHWGERYSPWLLEAEL